MSRVDLTEAIDLSALTLRELGALADKCGVVRAGLRTRKALNRAVVQALLTPDDPIARMAQGVQVPVPEQHSPDVCVYRELGGVQRFNQPVRIWRDIGGGAPPADEAA